MQSHSREEIQSVFNRLKENQYDFANKPISYRRAKLKALQSALMKYRSQIRKALQDDFSKPASEVDLVEIYPVLSEIKHTIKHLKKWTSAKSVSTPLAFFGAKSYIHYEPKGVVMIMAPWNFPVNLTLGPLVSAIAAGNTVVVKPSEHTLHSSAIIRLIVEEVFDPNEVAVVEGGIDTATALLELPFNHIFFTGAPAIGKIVMTAAAKHLSSVTLELGGKSPALVDETADINQAASAIAQGKFANAGQICIATDYILVHESKKKALLDALKSVLHSYYDGDAASSNSYTCIVNRKHTERIISMLDDAKSAGAQVAVGGNVDRNNRFVEPTIVTDMPLDCRLMEEEIFGPILPVVAYKNKEEAIALIKGREKPLALYIFSKSKSNINYFMNNTRAGGTCINNTAQHFYNHNLPFGGSNNSGIGKSHGHFGFISFSNERAVMKQNLPSVTAKLIPPYDAAKQKLIDFTLKWL